MTSDAKLRESLVQALVAGKHVVPLKRGAEVLDRWDELIAEEAKRASPPDSPARPAPRG